LSIQRGEIMAEQEYLTGQEVVTGTSLSITTVDRLIRAGQLPVLRVDRRVLIPRQAFQEWLQAQVERPQEVV
jgi:excisionase family DNA binding protein